MKKNKLSTYFSAYWKQFLLICLVLTVIGSVSAKYVSQLKGENVVTSKMFYFTSNFLEEGGTTIELNGNVTELSFTLCNYKDSLNFSEDTITYTLSVDGDYGAETPVLSTTSGTLTGGVNSEGLITISNLKKGKTYTITALGDAGYKKELSVTFTLIDDDTDLSKHLEVNATYVTLHVYSKKVVGTLDVAFTKDGLIPDDTNPIIYAANINNYDGGVYKDFNFSDNVNFNNVENSYAYIFFIDDATNVDINNFDVRIGDRVAIEKAP